MYTLITKSNASLIWNVGFVFGVQAKAKRATESENWPKKYVFQITLKNPLSKNMTGAPPPKIGFNFFMGLWRFV